MEIKISEIPTRINCGACHHIESEFIGIKTSSQLLPMSWIVERRFRQISTNAEHIIARTCVRGLVFECWFLWWIRVCIRVMFHERVIQLGFSRFALEHHEHHVHKKWNPLASLRSDEVSFLSNVPMQDRYTNRRLEQKREWRTYRTGSTDSRREVLDRHRRPASNPSGSPD